MKKLYYMFLLCGLLQTVAYAQTGSISGTVKDASGEALVGATVRILGTNSGAITNLDGAFTISKLSAGDYTVSVSSVGYSTMSREVTLGAGENASLDFSLEEGVVLGEGVVISGSRLAEKITESPATIEVISNQDIEQWASFNPGELLSRLKGVDYIRSGVAATGINVRGFNSNFNAKNLQVSDNRFATLIATGLPFGPLNSQIKEDIEQVEVILGPNAVLYGPNAHNGLVNIISKDPRSSEGTTVAIGAGNQSLLTARARHAQVVSDKFAYKVTAEYTRGEEFEYMDSVYIDRVGAFDSLGNAIPDGIKEGYDELELDRDFEFIRTEAGLYYSVTDESDLIFTYGHSNSTYLAPTNVGRNQIIDWRINTFHLRYTSPRLFAQVYHTTSRTDDTYSIDDRTKAYWSAIDRGESDAVARGEQSLAGGARFIDDSKRWNAEVQYNNQFGKLYFVTGVQWQRDMANSHGTYLLDEDEDDFITINQIGWYGQGRFDLGNGFKAIAAFRLDNHEVYDFNFLPKLGITKTTSAGTFRATYGKGIAAPTILNLYGDLFGGLILGNAEGFTLTDGSIIEAQKVEELQTFEVGYKGKLSEKLYLDANAYYNISENFLSPVTVIGVTTHRGDTPIEEVQSGFAGLGGLVATYRNFGKFNTYGTDIGLTYLINQKYTASLNYSYFDYPIDENDLDNDFTGDGTVNILDLLVNAPNNKLSLGLNANYPKFFGSIFMRWVEEFDYFSSFQIAAATQDLVYRGTPVVSDARGTDSWNYGPLGGFVNVDLGFGYRFNDTITLSGQVTNLFDAEVREFTASPFIGRLYSAELKFNF